MRLIDADALKKLRHDYIQGRLKFNGSEYDLIDKCPTIDAVPVVRCGECKHAGTHEAIFFPGHIACGLRMQPTIVKPDDFCSCGERREVVDNG